MSKLVEKRKEFEVKQDKLHKIFKEATSDSGLDLSKVKGLEGDIKQKVEAIQKMNKELEDMGVEIDALVILEKASKDTDERQKGIETPFVHPDGKGKHSIGEMFTSSDAFKNYKGGVGPVAKLDIDLKTLFQTSAGWAPETIRTGKVVEFATRPIQVIDIVPPGVTNQTAIVYMEETTFTNTAAEVAEAGVKPEAALVLIERTSSVRKISVWIPVTDEQLEDVDGIQSYLNNRLTFMLKQRLDGQLIVGNGVAPNLTGLLNVTGIQSFVMAGNRFDAVYEGIKRVRVTGRAEPNVILFHPNDWQQLRLMRTNDGLYILGNPTEPGPARIWGSPIVETTAETENTVLVGDFINFCQLFEKKGVEIQISDSHDTYFIYNKKVVRADIRVAFPCYRPAAFCEITGF